MPYTSYGAASGSSSPANITNLKPQNLTHWRAALARVRSGAGSARLAFIGDSTTYGSFSTNAATGNMAAYSYPKVVSDCINSAGVAADWQNFWGTGNYNGSAGAGSMYTDSRVSYTGAWTQYYLNPAYGGNMPQCGGAGTLSFKPTTNVDTFKVWYVNGNATTFNINVNGGASTSVTTNGSLNVLSATVTAALGSNTLNIAWVSGANIFIVGIEAWNSAVNRVNILNGAWPSSSSANWNNNSFAWSPLSFAPSVAADLTVIDLGINDWNGGVSIPYYTANMQAIITAAKATGDVCLLTPMPSDPSRWASMTTQQNFVNAMYQLAQSNNLPLLDLWARWQSFSLSSPLGFYYADGLHALALGHADQGRFIANALLSV